jgi:hypothetical protein
MVKSESKYGSAKGKYMVNVIFLQTLVHQQPEAALQNHSAEEIVAETVEIAEVVIAAEIVAVVAIAVETVAAAAVVAEEIHAEVNK